MILYTKKKKKSVEFGAKNIKRWRVFLVEQDALLLFCT